MRIALVIEKFDPAAGGNERSTEQIARRLIARGHEVTILASRGAAEALPGGSIRLAPWLSTKTALGLMLFVRWAQAQLRTGNFDVSVSMTTAACADVIEPRGGTVRETLARNIAMRPGEVRRTLKQLSLWTRPKQLVLLAAERRALNNPRLKRIVAISKYVADQLFHHYMMRSKNVALIPNAAEIRALDPQARAELRQRTRAALTINDHEVVFVFAAMNPGLKGLPHLLAAMQSIQDREPRARLVIAGTHPRHAPMHHAIRWIGPTRQMDALYAAADVTVLPTWYDPSSKVVLESLLHGVPAISTLHNGASQWIFDPTGERQPPSPFDPHQAEPLIHGKAGRIIRNPADVDALADAMIQLCDDDVRAACAAATEGLAAKISMDVHVDQLEALLRELVESTENQRQTAEDAEHAEKRGV
jgi:UDP-glucose:(heptosyl)LPS alpha-1,3-glucosyltransferase